MVRSLANSLHLHMLTSLRGYTINNHWPRSGVTVPAIKGMYNKMLSSEKPASGATATNGQKNGA